jgi:hypothetical protein
LTGAIAGTILYLRNWALLQRALTQEKITMSPILTVDPESLRHDCYDPQEADRIMRRIMNHQPVYWPENFDENGEHTIGHHRDFDVCDDCGRYGDVFYWWGGGVSITPAGLVIPNPKVPLCHRCAEELMR